MSSAAVGIVGREPDAEVRALAQALARRGAEPVVLDFFGYPGEKRLSLGGGRISYEGRDLAALGAVYVRQTGFTWPFPSSEHAAAPPPAAEWEGRRSLYEPFPEREREVFASKYAALHALASLGVAVVNPPEANDLHRLKLLALTRLRAAGLRVPRFAAGTDGAGLAAFAAAEPRGAVVKPLAGIHKTVAWGQGAEAAVAQRPLLVEEYVPGATVRAYFVAGEVVAAGRILSAGEVDSSIGQRGIEPVALPAEAAELGREALRRLGLSFSGVDFQVDEATGEHVLLDCNAAPMFANFSQMAGVDIADRLAAHLLGRAEER